MVCQDKQILSDILDRFTYSNEHSTFLEKIFIKSEIF